MVWEAPSRDNRDMKNKTTPNRPPLRRIERVAELEEEIDERDETIRLLNEALSRALDELAALDRAA